MTCPKSIFFTAYGQTECTAIATITWLTDNTAGHCGGPATCTVLKLADVPEMNYYASEGKGEIVVKGPNNTQGYFKVSKQKSLCIIKNLLPQKIIYIKETQF